MLSRCKYSAKKSEEMKLRFLGYNEETHFPIVKWVRKPTIASQKQTLGGKKRPSVVKTLTMLHLVFGTIRANKAGYTATKVACLWAGAIWAGAVRSKKSNHKKSKV